MINKYIQQFREAVAKLEEEDRLYLELTDDLKSSSMYLKRAIKNAKNNDHIPVIIEQKLSKIDKDIDYIIEMIRFR